MQLNATNGFAARPDARWMARASTSLPVPVSPVRRTVDVGGRDPLRDREDLGHLLGDPEPAVGLERVGGPQRGALLLLAPIPVDRDGRVDELADGHARAPVVECRAQLGDDLPGLVAVDAAGDAQPFAGLLRGLDRLGLGPAAGASAPNPTFAASDQRLPFGRAAQLQERIGLAAEHVRGSPPTPSGRPHRQAVERWRERNRRALVLEVRRQRGVLDGRRNPSSTAIRGRCARRRPRTSRTQAPVWRRFWRRAPERG